MPHGTNSQSLAQLLGPAPDPIMALTGVLLFPLSVKDRERLFTVKKIEEESIKGN